MGLCTQSSRSVKPDAVRVDATSSNSALIVTAFQNVDKSIAVQVINNGDEAQSIDLQGLPVKGSSSMKRYLTDNNNDLEIGSVRLTGRRIRDKTPAFAMKTYLTSH